MDPIIITDYFDYDSEMASPVYNQKTPNGTKPGGWIEFFNRIFRD